LINNRQAGRRRGRGGQRSQGGNPGRPDNGNRIDNRARGNAAQLLEKYKTLARDAQMQGDRINTEYYLQFADHYFRVLNESRARFEDQNRRQQNEAFDEGDEEDFDGDNIGDDVRDVYSVELRNGNAQNNGRERGGHREDGGRGDNGQDREQRFHRENGQRDNGQRDNGPRDNGQRDNVQRDAREERTPRFERADADADAAPLAQEPDHGGAAVASDDQRRRRGRPRRTETPSVEAGADTGAAAIDADRLPPSLVAGADEAGAKPRRRRARPAAETAAAD